jgi:putative ABC transport system permease protein
MTLLFRGLVLRPAKRNPLRVILSVAGVAIGVAAICAISRANHSVMDSFRGAVDAVSGRTRLCVTGVDGVTESAGSRIAWIWDVGSFAPVVDRFAVCADGTDEPVEVFGIDITSEPPLRAYRLVEPSTPEGLRKLFEKDSALAPLPFALRHRLRVGDELPLFAAGRRRALRVIGLLEFSGPARAAGGQLVVTGLNTAQELFDIPGRVDRLDITFPDTVALRTIEERVKKSLPAGLSVQRPQARSETADKMIRAFRLNLAALGSIALLVGMFLIYNTVSISVLRRRTEIGALRALGASKASLFTAFLAEGLLLGTAGTLLGEFAGVLLSKAALAAVGTTVVNIYSPTAKISLSGSRWPYLLSAAAGLGASLAASLAPAAEAANIAPATTMRPGSVERARRARVGGRSLLAAASAAAGFLLCFLPPVAGFPAFGFLAVGCAVAALALLTPGAILVGERGLRPVFSRLFRSPGRLACAFFAGNISRNAVAIAALALALGMTAAMAVMISSLRSTVEAWVDQSVASDLFLKSATGNRRGIIGTMPAEAIEFVRGIPGVAALDPYRGIEVTDPSGNPFTLGSGDFEAAAKIGLVPLLSGDDPPRVLAEARARGEVIVSEPFARRFGKWRGGTVILPTPSGPRSFRVADVYPDYSNDRGTVVLDRALFLSLFHDPAVSTIAVQAAPGVSPDVLRVQILAAARGKFAFSILTNRLLRREVLKIFDRTFAVTWGLEIIALAVAVLGVANALFALILERRRELGLLQILGASRRQLRRSIQLEAGLIGLCALLLALLSAAAFAAVLILVVNRQAFGWGIRTHVPWAELAGAALLALLTALASALVPSQLAERVDPAQALREE